MNKRFALFAAVMLSFGFAVADPAAALEKKAYDAAAVASDMVAGKSVVIHVTAPWCSTCTAQKSAIETFKDDPALKDVVLYELDYDNGGAALKDLNVRSQSTLIAYKGEMETGRSAGDTSAKGIETLMKSAL
jgi:thioredoxin 1